MNKITIQKELAKLAVYYPQAKRSVEEISLLTDMWSEDLERMREDRFLECVKAHRQRSSFFPVPHNIIEISREIDNRGKVFVAIGPPQKSDEEVAKIKQIINNFRNKLGVTKNNGNEKYHSKTSEEGR